MNGPDQLAVQAWIASELSIDGVLAAGGGISSEVCFSALTVEQLPTAGNDHVWQTIGRAIADLEAQSVPTGETLWAFEYAVLCIVRRADGLWLGTFTRPVLDDASAVALRTKLDAFKVQPFGN